LKAVHHRVTEAQRKTEWVRKRKKEGRVKERGKSLRAVNISNGRKAPRKVKSMFFLGASVYLR
jgi:hypothetical protein